MAIVAAGPVLRAEGPLTLSPSVLKLVDDQEHAFTATVDGAPATCAWTVVQPRAGAFIRPGVFKPALVDHPTVVTILARTDRGQLAQARVLVIPKGLALAFQMAGDEGWMDQLYARDLPFLDLETGQRMTGADVEEKRTKRAMEWVGFGLPFRADESREGPAVGRLLSHLSPTGVLRKDVTNQAPGQMVIEGFATAVTDERLTHTPTGMWFSDIVTTPVQVTGVLPFAGLAATPGREDGTPVQARFMEPFGVVSVPGWGTLVSDRADHVIRRIDEDEGVTTWCGTPGQAGSEDGPGAQASFQGPTFMTALHDLPPPVLRGAWMRRWFLDTKDPRDRAMVVVADTGNHRLRVLRHDGTVETLAGSRRGHRNHGHPLLARFNQPKGLAFDRGGNLYVADAGNHVIRVLTPSGTVITLAGKVGEPGEADGTGTHASFTDLKGLAVYDGALWVVDGHAVRRVSFLGEVTTVAGAVTSPGYLERWNAPAPGEVKEGAAAPSPLKNVPCFREPTDLWVSSSLGVIRILVTDTGNHALRTLHLNSEGEPVALKTFAGDPDLASVRHGLLRCGIPGPLDAAYGAVGGLRCLGAAFKTLRHDAMAFVFTSGHAVSRASLGGRIYDFERLVEPFQEDEVKCPAQVQVDTPFEVTLSLQYPSPQIHWHMTFRQGDGKPVEARGTGRAGIPSLNVPGVFHRPGPATVTVRYVTQEGFSAHFERGVEVQARPASSLAPAQPRPKTGEGSANQQAKAL